MFTAVSEDRKLGPEPESIQQRAVGIPGRWNPAHTHPHLQQAPQSHASPCLSPVNTQILMLASVRMAMVSGTPCCSLSSMAVAPSSLGTQKGRKSAGTALSHHQPQPSVHLPSYHAPPHRRDELGDPHEPQGHCQLGAAAQTSPCSSSPPGLCRPAPVSAAPRQRTPASGQSWVCWQTLMVSPDPSGVPRTRHKPSSASWAAIPSSPPCLQDLVPRTLRWSVVMLVRSWLTGCSRSSRMVSAPLQYSRILPSGLRTAGRRG